MIRTALPLNNDPEVDEFDSIQPDFTATEALGASFELAKQDTAVMSHARSSSLEELKNRGGTLLTPEKANAMYPGLAVPFREDIHPFAAQEIYDRSQERDRLQRISAGGPDTIAMGVARFGAGMVAHLMDPVETGLGLALSGGAALAIPSLAKAGLATKIGVDVAANLVENVASETLVRDAAITEQQEYDAMDFMVNVGAGAFAMPALGLAVRGSKKAFSKMGEFFESKPPEVQVKASQITVNTLMQNKVPDINALKTAIMEETNFKPQDNITVGGKNYEFKDNYNQPASGKKFYVPVKDATDLDTNVKLSDSVGNDIQGTDNPALANGVLNPSIGSPGGKILEIDLDEVPKIDFRDSFPEDIKLDGVDTAGKTVGDVVDNIKDLINSDKLPETAMDDFNLKLSEKGYKVVTSDGTKAFGETRSPHNQVHILDKSVIKDAREFDPDTSLKKSFDNPKPPEPRDLTFDDAAIDQFEKEFINAQKDITDDLK